MNKPEKPAVAQGAATKTLAKPNNPPVARAVAATRPTKADRLVELLSEPGGVAMIEITGALGIQAHSARAQISTLRKRRNLVITLVDGRYAVRDIGPRVTAS